MGGGRAARSRRAPYLLAPPFLGLSEPEDEEEDPEEELSASELASLEEELEELASSLSSSLPEPRPQNLDSSCGAKQPSASSAPAIIGAGSAAPRPLTMVASVRAGYGYDVAAADAERPAGARGVSFGLRLRWVVSGRTEWARWALKPVLCFSWSFRKV